MQNDKSIRDQSSQKVLVTGGGGFLGSAIIERLVKRGDRAVSFSRRFYSELAAMGVEQIQGDISDAAAVEQACRSADLVFHVAAKPGVWGDYVSYYQTNVMGTRNVIAACKQHTVSRLIYTSSPSVVFDGTNMEGVDESVPYPEKYLTHYPKTKAMAEQLVIAAADEGLKTIVLRPHLIWGPDWPPIRSASACGLLGLETEKIWWTPSTSTMLPTLIFWRRTSWTKTVPFPERSISSARMTQFRYGIWSIIF